jgi:hypothetical protein
MKDLEALGEDLLTDLLGAHNLHLHIPSARFLVLIKKKLNEF